MELQQLHFAAEAGKSESREVAATPSFALHLLHKSGAPFNTDEPSSPRFARYLVGVREHVD